MQVPPIEKPIVGKGMLSAPKLSSWEAAFDGNRRRSRILQLPDEILFEIMQMVELDDLYMLRQVSCTFLRIYNDQTFQRLHRKVKSRIFWQWQWQGNEDGFELDPKTVTRARRNVFCDPCFKVKESEEYRSRLKKCKITFTVHSATLRTGSLSFPRRSVLTPKRCDNVFWPRDSFGSVRTVKCHSDLPGNLLFLAIGRRDWLQMIVTP
ncbi:hypothetical protein CCHR01_07056 [Colletotrichum chrysophilum]|uniref:F-box domain-containing protein n=1 Tax=Colletotrichum chrysophilum TaxID=1836956 RepID=A0AAD9AMJ1_9PEZI|nr:hypothetical protein CCHR01_07056 [Colletotrichum chrysophilum]